MNRTSKLAAQVAGAMALAMMFGTSAFAESRHWDATQRNETGQRHERRGDAQQSQRSDRGTPNQSFQRHDNSQWQQSNRWQQSQQSNQWQRSRDNQRNDNRGYSGYSPSQAYQRGGSRTYNQGTYNQRGYDRSQTWNDRSQGFRNNDRGSSAFRGETRRSFSSQGRISRIEHERGGYRLWLDRGGYSYWVPETRFRSFPYRVGLSIRLGGYLDPLGFVDVYDIGGYPGTYGYGYGSTYSSTYSSGVLHGVVETVDYRRGTLVLRDDLSGNFVTIVMRDAQMNDLRPGDSIDISGAWTRTGVFEAYRLDNIGGGRY